MNKSTELTWIETMQVARFLKVPVADVAKLPIHYVEQVLVIARAEKEQLRKRIWD